MIKLKSRNERVQVADRDTDGNLEGGDHLAVDQPSARGESLNYDNRLNK